MYDLNVLPDLSLVGQNLAREMGRLDDLESRVERWYIEYKQYTYSKFESPMSAAVCSKGLCGHYTQVSRGETRRFGRRRQGTQVSSFLTHSRTSARSVIAKKFPKSRNNANTFFLSLDKPLTKGTYARPLYSQAVIAVMLTLIA